ncbi:MAG: winged helix-turn-helix domain-containing protein [Methanobrevibacter sp.]|jgi:predicted transcriptional regulator|nr:winged helix-turn-helix domain-containing protein [Candidatus Methanoflexus mossambicus]
MNKKIVELLSFIKSSKYREKIIVFIADETKIPSEIAKGIRLSYTHTSKHLNALKKKKIVTCLNENAKRGRLYQLTKLGKEILAILKK